MIQRKKKETTKFEIEFYAYFTDYKRYPTMYVSPLTERMRKRRAFADNELESSTHLFALSSVSSVSNLSTPYSRLSMSMPTAAAAAAVATGAATVPLNMHLSTAIDYSAIHQSTMITNDNESPEYLSAQTPSSIDNYRSNECYPCAIDSLPAHRIRIIDDAKLCNMDRQNNEPLIYSPSANEHSHCTSAKPKLSFSIESIIGIKWWNTHRSANSHPISELLMVATIIQILFFSLAKN